MSCAPVASTRLGRIGASLAAIEDEPTLLQKTTGALIAKLGILALGVLRHRCRGVRRAAGRLDRRRAVRHHAGHCAAAGRVPDGAGDLHGARGLPPRPAQGAGAPRRRDRDARRGHVPVRRQDRHADREPDGAHHGLAGRQRCRICGAMAGFPALPSSRSGRHCSHPPSARSIPWTGPSACWECGFSPESDWAEAPLRTYPLRPELLAFIQVWPDPLGRRSVCRKRGAGGDFPSLPHGRRRTGRDGCRGCGAGEPRPAGAGRGIRAR